MERRLVLKTRPRKRAGFESSALRQSLGSVQQTKTLVLCKVLADKNDPVNYYDPYTLTLKPMCSVIKMGDNLESDRYKKE